MGNPDNITIGILKTFKGLIADGMLSPGQRLPAERELSAMFGISRGSLRPALQVLEMMGIISRRVGDGTYLASGSEAILSEPLDFLVLVDDISHLELFESRIIVEPELAALAAERAKQSDLDALAGILEAMKRGTTNIDKIMEHDLAFHGGVFRAAGNRVCERFFGVVQKALMQSLSRTSRLNVPREIVASHQAIYDAIYERDPVAARRMMTEHIVWGKETVLGQQQERPGKSGAIDIKPLKTK